MSPYSFPPPHLPSVGAISRHLETRPANKSSVMGGASKDGGVAWVHADDAVRALDVIATSPAFAEGDAASATTVILDASKPFQSAQLEAAGFKYEYTDLKRAQPSSSGLV